jgi:hypothetical protein
VVFPSWLYLVVYLIVVRIACNFTIACLRFDAYFRMSVVQLIVGLPISSTFICMTVVWCVQSVGKTDSCVNILKLLYSLKISAFWDISPCNLVVVYRRFRSAYCLHHQPLKRRSTSTRLLGSTTQRAVIFRLAENLKSHNVDPNVYSVTLKVSE